jgi:nucleotide-binding universal stress UspA family protein
LTYLQEIDRVACLGEEAFQDRRDERRRRMAKKILIAVDESKSSMKAVKYVGRGMEKTGSVTLLSIIPDATGACDLDGRTLTPLFKQNRQAFCAIEEAKKGRVEAFMADAKEALVQSGFSPKNIAVKVRKKKLGIARDVLKEAQQGKYTTLVIGRRGLSGFKQFFMGSVSNKIVQLAKSLSVVVVD